MSSSSSRASDINNLTFSSVSNSSDNTSGGGFSMSSGPLTSSPQSVRRAGLFGSMKRKLSTSPSASILSDSLNTSISSVASSGSRVSSKAAKEAKRIELRRLLDEKAALVRSGKRVPPVEASEQNSRHADNSSIFRAYRAAESPPSPISVYDQLDEASNPLPSLPAERSVPTLPNHITHEVADVLSGMLLKTDPSA